VFSAVAEQMGLDYQTAVKVSAGFGGGMYLGSVCGAVTGGIMAIGVKYGGLDRKAQLRTAGISRQFADRFKAQHRSINCPDLIGLDLSTFDISKPETIKPLLDKNVFARCQGYVKDAATIVNELVNDAPA
jgi:C_GCAxxG_C_C family probable redox protein